MSFLTDSALADVLRSQNPWWVSGTLPRSFRHTQPRIQDGRLLETERPTLVVGPRRAGKTATLHRLLDAHLRAGGDPRQALYLPIDHPMLRLVPLGPLVDRALRHAGGDVRPLLLIDGIQAIPDWPTRFTELVKTRPHPRIVAAASVAPGVEESAYETVVLPPLRFHEFCALRGVPELETPSLDLLEPQVPDEPEPQEDFLFDRLLDPVLADYLVRGGFPEAALETDLPRAQRTVREEVVARAVYQDLPAVVGVVKITELERVLLAALVQDGAPTPTEALADELELAPHTFSRYVEHLGRAFLLTRLKNFAASTERSRTILHPTDPAVPNALLERGAGVLARPVERRSLLAAAVVGHVQEFARPRGFDVAYLRDGDAEADVVLVHPEGVVPVVVVDREEVGEEEAALVEKVLRSTGARHVFLLSRARPRRRKPVSFFESVVHLPVGYFLYALQA